MHDRLEARFNLQSKRTDLLQSEVDIRAQELLKHREEFMDRLRYNGLQDYAELIFPSTGDLRNHDSDSPEEEVPRQQTSLHAALMATPAKKSKITSIASNQRHEDTTTDKYNMDHWESVYLAAGMHERFLLDKEEMMRREIQDIRMASSAAFTSQEHREDTEPEPSTAPQDDDDEDPDSDTAGSFNEEPERPPQQIRRKESKKRGGYIHPIESEEDRSEATASISRALDQVHKTVHSNPEGKRRAATLYVGNVHYNASEQDLREALDKIFKRVRVDKITIPRVNGRSLYAFIEISWAASAPVKTSDLCTMHNSGKVQVNSRPIYFRELRDKSAKK